MKFHFWLTATNEENKRVFEDFQQIEARGGSTVSAGAVAFEDLFYKISNGIVLPNDISSMTISIVKIEP